MGLFDAFSSAADPGGLYGDMLTPQQKQALAYRGLLGAAASFGQSAMPSRMPVPIGAVLGQAAGAMGESQDAAAKNAMQAQLQGLQGQNLRSQMQTRQRLEAVLPQVIQMLSGG